MASAVSTGPCACGTPPPDRGSSSPGFSSDCARRCVRLPGRNPDVSIEHRIAVALKLERAATLVLLLSAGCGPFQLEVVMNHHAVLFEGDSRIFDLPAGVVEFHRCELDVVGLPRQWREAHVRSRRWLCVDGIAFVVLAFESKRI